MSPSRIACDGVLSRLCRTWVLTTEDIMEPPRLLKKECAALGIPEGDFDICGLGQTRFF